MSDSTGVDVFVSRLESSADTVSGTYSVLPLRDEIREIGVEVGDSVLGSIEEDSEGVQWLRYRWHPDNSPRYAVKVQSGGDRRFPLCITVKKEYLSNPSPVEGLEPGDRVVVELDYDREEFRVYNQRDHGRKGTSEGYRFRHSPAASPFLLEDEDGPLFELGDEGVDFSAKTEFVGQKFTFKAANGIDLRNRGLEPTDGDLTSFFDENQVLLQKFRAVIFWDPDPRQKTSPAKVFQLPDLGAPASSQSLVLPERGSYHIRLFCEVDHDSTNVDVGGSGRWKWEDESWLAFDESGSLRNRYNVTGDWFTPYFSRTEEGVVVWFSLVPSEKLS